jgi:hypothetical protein
VSVPTIVPNSEELQPVLLTSKYGSKTHGNGDSDGGGYGAVDGSDHVPANATNLGKNLR